MAWFEKCGYGTPGDQPKNRSTQCVQVSKEEETLEKLALEKLKQKYWEESAKLQRKMESDTLSLLVEWNQVRVCWQTLAKH